MRQSRFQREVGPYRLEELLPGGRSEVWRALDLRLDRWVVLKRVDSGAREGRTRADPLREARLIARLDHPNLVRVHDIVEHDGEQWIVMEWIEGDDLGSLLSAGPLPMQRFFDIARQLLSGLAAAHEAGILHLDLKTENVIAMTGGGLKILDFGLAEKNRPLADDRATGVSDLRGTPRAMSPEQALGRATSPRSDLFSLGVLFYELLSDRSPFLASGIVETTTRVCHHPHRPLHQRQPSIPEPLSDLVDRLLEKQPEKRPSSAREVLDLLVALERSTAGSQRSEAPPTLPSSAPATIPAPPPGAEPVERPRSRPEMRRLTLVSCDLMSTEGDEDNLDSGEFLEILPILQNRVADILERHGGRAIEVLGHRVVACFGYPSSVEDGPWCAVGAALEICRCADDLLSEETIDSSRPRCGVHTGASLILPRHGDSGGSPIAPGKGLNLADQLRESAAEGEVLVCRATHLATRGLFEVEAQKACPDSACEPLDAFRILGREVEGIGGRGPVSRSRLVGRERELALLDSGLSAAIGGSGRLVVLGGEAGIGKSRLIAELRQRATAPAGIRWLETHGSPTFRNEPLLPAASLLRKLAGTDPHIHEEAQWRALEPLLVTLGSSVDEARPLIGPLIGRPTLERSRIPASRTLSARELVADLLATSLEQRPGVLIFEDVQWMDMESSRLISLLARHVRGLGALLVLTYRPGPGTLWVDELEASRLDLGPLSPAETTTLAEHYARDRGADALPLEPLIDEAEGVPGFVEALVDRALAAGGEQERGVGRVPTSILHTTVCELDAIGAPRSLVLAAARCGPEIRPDALGQDADGNPEEIRNVLDGWARAGLLRRSRSESGVVYGFRREMLRQAALDHLGIADRIGGLGPDRSGR